MTYQALHHTFHVEVILVVLQQAGEIQMGGTVSKALVLYLCLVMFENWLGRCFLP